MKKLILLSLSVLLGSSILSPVVYAQHADTSEAITAIGTFKPAEGLRLELFAAEPLLNNPVAFSIDEHGRFFISETHRYREAIFDITKNTQWLLEDLAFRTVAERSAFLSQKFTTNFNILTNKSEIVRLVEDRDGNGKADRSSIFAEHFRESISGTAAGILARDNAVWFTCIPDLWKLQDSNGDGVSDQAEKLHSGFGVRIGVTGHDLHGLVMGPDGRLYFSIGDRAYAPPDNIKGYGFPTAFLKRILPDTGAVFRCNPDGSDFEVFAIGLRNPQELVFDHLGNLWTVDNDTAGKDDARVIHVVQGGDYGWRVSYQHQKNFGPWVEENLWQGKLDDVLPLAGVTAQGPAGLTYNPGPYLGEKYRNHFFICDFPRGVWAFNVEPAGASFKVKQKEQFIWGIWATDVDFGNDGSFYVADWTPGWNPNDKGRLYRVTGEQVQTDPAAAKLRAHGFADQGCKELLNLLNHPDYRIRREAQFAVVRKVGPSVTTESAQAFINGLWRIAEGKNETSARHALWALEQISRKIKPDEALEEFLQPAVKLFSHSSPEIRSHAAWLIGESHSTHFNQHLRRLLTDSEPRVSFNAALSLGKLRDTSSAAKLAELAGRNADTDPFITHAAVSALACFDDVNVLLPLAKSSEHHIRRATLLAMRRLEHPAIQQFLNDPDPRQIAEAARAINDVPITTALPALADCLNKLSPGTNGIGAIGITNAAEQILTRAINANFRLGTTINAQALASFARNTNATIELRIEALSALADWAKPYALERVMGLWRPLPERSPVPAAQALKQIAGYLWTSPSAPLLAATAEATSKLGLTEMSPTLLKMFLNTKLPLSARISALNALDTLSAHELTQAVKAALEGQNLSLRREGVRLIDRAQLMDAAALLERIVDTEKDIRLAQSAYAALGSERGAQAEAALTRQLGKLLNGEIRKEVQLDLLEAAEKRSTPAIKTLLKQYAAKRQGDDFIAEYREVLYGGDAVSGRKLITARMDVKCLRCHQVGAAGGLVGPSLNGVGKRLTKEQLLEAIMLPNRQIALGYENATFVLKNGTNASGLVKDETATEVIVESAEDGMITIKKTDVERRIASLSAMPDGLGERLSKQELRDMVEYLSNLKK